MPYFLQPTATNNPTLIGGKATKLSLLADKNFNIPKWVVLPKSIYLETKQVGFKLELETFQNELLASFGTEAKNKRFAIRSSAIGEDGTEHSFAGLFESHLNVSFDQIPDKIKSIYDSVNSNRVIKYKERHNINHEIEMAVIVQEMIDATSSGVAFGAHPVSGDTDTKIINAVYGLGEGLVSGDLNSDSFEIKQDVVKTLITKKEHQYITRDSGIEKVSLEAYKHETPSLSNEQVHEISSILESLKRQFKSPQDIEFSYQNNQLYLLQTRSITTLKPKEEYTIWDNSNIIESYPGITTPLTFSFIEKMYEMVYKQLTGLMGVREKDIEANTLIFENTLGLVRGRVYYNLLSWYKMLAMVPGYSLNASFMETMMGVKEKFELKEDFKMTKGMAWFRIIVMAFKMIILQVKLPKERVEFYKQVDGVLKKFHKIDYSKISSKETVSNFLELEKTLLMKWKAPLVNDFFSMIWFGSLQKQVAKLLPDETNLHNDLLCGSHDIISVEPIHRSLKIARKIEKNKVAKSLFSTHTPEQVWSTLQEEKFSSIRALIIEYLEKFGERCVGELKLETISYRQDPTAFIKIIQSYVTNDISKKNINTNTENKIRKAAEQKVNNVLKKGLKKRLFTFILNQARSHVSNRENLRFERTRAFGLVRKIFNALGTKLVEENQIETARDIFYLELDEIKSLYNNSLDKNIIETIKTRKLEFENYKTQDLPIERFFTYGKNFTNEYIYSTEKLEELGTDLQGIGCCPGVVKAKVTVVANPQEINSLNNTILVTTSTDPGWVTLFPSAAGIIVERGSLLSHSAIVSREMGIPCIVGVSHLLRALKTGDEVVMNGSSGEITLIN